MQNFNETIASLDFTSAAQYIIHFTYYFIVDSFITGTLEPTSDQVRASHRYREVTGSNPVEVLDFSGFFTQLLKLRS